MATHEAGRAMVATFPVANLTTREYECLALVAEGLTNAQIGDRLGLTAQAVTLRLTDAYRRLGLAHGAHYRMLAAGLIGKERHRLSGGGFWPDAAGAAA